MDPRDAAIVRGHPIRSRSTLSATIPEVHRNLMPGKSAGRAVVFLRWSRRGSDALLTALAWVRKI